MADVQKSKSLQTTGEIICQKLPIDSTPFDGVCQSPEECLFEAIELNQASLNLKGEAVGLTVKTYARALFMSCDTKEKADAAIIADLMCPLFTDPFNGFAVFTGGPLEGPAHIAKERYAALLSAIQASGLCLL